MAIYHLSATPIQRSKGYSAVAAAAYRAGERLYDGRTGETYDYTRKSGVIVSAIVAPENAPAWTNDRAQLWNQAELAENRKDARPAREIRLALPEELTDEQRANLVFDFCRDAFVKNGMVADISIHRPDRHGDGRNHHAHILLTMRELDGDRFAASKNRDWNKTEMLEAWREQWAEHQNAALERAGEEARVDHRSLTDQGITDRLPQEHHGKGEHIQRKGKESERMEELQRDAAAYSALQAEHAAVTAELDAMEETTLSPEAELHLQRIQAKRERFEAEDAKEAAALLASNDTLTLKLRPPPKAPETPRPAGVEKHLERVRAHIQRLKTWLREKPREYAEWFYSTRRKEPAQQAYAPDNAKSKEGQER